MPAGRPSEYDPAYCERVIALGKQGKSRAEIASALDCSRNTLTAWEKANPEFLSALQRASDESLAWWEGKGRTGIEKGAQFNAGLWGKCMSGRFPNEPYRERLQVTGKGDGPVQFSNLTDAELDRRIAELRGEVNGDEPAADA